MCCCPGSSIRERDLLIQVSSQPFEMLGDLFCELLRRHQNEPPRGFKAITCILSTESNIDRQSPRNATYGQRRTHSWFRIQYLLNQRYAIRCCLSGPRTCPSEDVSILQCEWDGFGLDQSGVGKPHVGQSA